MGRALASKRERQRVWRHYVQAGEVWGAQVWNGIRCINIGNDSAILFQENEVMKNRFNI